jgi:hypothetical protein
MQVNPKNEDVRRVLAHPKAGKFRAQGSVDWPDDTFTHRRIADGDITKVESEQKEEKHEKAKFVRKAE